jgi:hypothetical protein
MRLFNDYKMVFMLLFICVVATLLYYLKGDPMVFYGVPIAFGVSFLYRMPSGIAGDVQRHEHATIEPGIFDASYPCLKFGILIKTVSGKVRPIASADVIATVQKGFLVRPFPIQEPIASTAADELLGGGAPNIAYAANVMKRGYMTVLVGAGGATAFASIVKDDPVYCRQLAAVAPLVGSVGDIEAGSATGNSAITGCYFMGPADSNGFCEIAFNI